MTDASLTLASRVMRTPGTVDAEVDGETVALDVAQGMFYGLNPVGSQIWRIIAEPIGIDAVCTRLLAAYDVDRATCEAQVLDLCRELREAGLIVVADATAA